VDFGSTSLSSSGSTDVFVAKIDTSGNWAWARRGGGPQADRATSVSIDSYDNVYLCGDFSDSASFGSHSLTSSGRSDIFVAKLDLSGDWLWVERAGGSDSDYCEGIEVDYSNDIYIAGDIDSSADFGEFTINSDGDCLYVAKMDSTGNWYWVNNADDGDDSWSGIADIDSDSSGNLYLTGFFVSSLQFGETTIYGEYDVFIVKIDYDGIWGWAKSAGGTRSEYGEGIALSSRDDIYVVGNFYSPSARFGSFRLESESSDVFITKLDSEGNWQWALQAIGSVIEEGWDIVIDTSENAYITGYFSGESVDFGSTTLENTDGADMFVAKVDSNGNWIWAKSAYGGISRQSKGYIDIDSSGNAYVTGTFEGTATFGSTSLTSSGERDLFVAKLGQTEDSDGDSNEGNSGSIIQQPNHDWKNGLLCRVELLCFQKMVNAADDSDKLTYIDQEVIITIPNTDGTESVNVIITDENGVIVSRQPMTCTYVGGSSSCTGNIAIETQEVKAYFDDTIGDIVHDGLAEFFKNEAAGLTTSILVKIAIPVVCVVVGIIAGVAAIPVGSACYHALWGLYAVVKSITFLLSLVTYYNIVDDNLGSYENKVFPNRYVSAIEVDGVTRDMVDVRLDRLNDVSESELEEIGKHDSLEFIGLSPIDFQLSRNGATLADDEDLLRISGDSAFEMMLVIDPEQHDAVIVEGTGDGTYSIIGIYNDADIPVWNPDDEEAVFANLFMAEEDVSISDGEIINYVDHDSMNWYNEADIESSGAEPLNIALIILSIIALAGMCYFMVLKRLRGKDGTRTTTLTEEMPTRVNTPKGMPPDNPMIQQQPMIPQQPVIPQQPMMQQQPMMPPEGIPPRGQPLPNANWKGVWGEDGYERLEHPQGSGVWYWRDQQTGQWVRH
jgi:hypothetical protein